MEKKKKHIPKIMKVMRCHGYIIALQWVWEPEPVPQMETHQVRTTPALRTAPCTKRGLRSSVKFLGSQISWIIIDN